MPVSISGILNRSGGGFGSTAVINNNLIDNVPIDSIHIPCIVATLGNVSLSSGWPDQVLYDNVTLDIDDRILVWRQNNAIENGIYKLVGDGTLIRDVDTFNPLDMIPVQEGSTYATIFFIITNITVPVIDTDIINFITAPRNILAHFATVKNPHQVIMDQLVIGSSMPQLTTTFDNTLITKLSGSGTLVYDVTNPAQGNISIVGGTVTKIGKLLAYQFHVIFDQDNVFILEMDASLIPGEIVSMSVVGDDGSLDHLGLRSPGPRQIRFNRLDTIDADLDAHMIVWVDGGTEIAYVT